MTKQQILVQRDTDNHVGRITLNRPDKKNSYDLTMRNQLADALDELAEDDTVKAVVLRGSNGIFSTGADMGNAYRWYAKGEELDRPSKSRPSQRTRIAVDRNTFDFYRRLGSYPKVTVAEVTGYALGGGLEMALYCDMCVIGEDTRIGMPATRFLGPALGSLHLFFYRLGPTLTKRLLLTGDIVQARALSHLNIFTETLPDEQVPARAAWLATKAARMPADGIAIAKEAFRLVEQLQHYQGEDVISPLIHAFATNLQFSAGEFNFVKTRALHGTRQAFAMRDEHFEVPEPQ
ncbi:enoyl-CoA hydratase/isomerase family protein [Nakamurella lactea]|uniref:enoyl-CoA hydratase/isomerase family protein n=1 Tax=Nakamurella lactea TaxID=459515 RepID=UPI0004118E02|nr:enoyl-CoA hydratase/isomerase family protein [Nakamurella lactea]